MALPLQSLLSNLLQSDQSDWRKRLVQEWATLVGDLHTKMRLERISQDNTVIIGVYDIHWMHELHMLSPLIIQTMNEKLGAVVIKKVRFVVIDMASDKTAKKSFHQEETAKKTQTITLTPAQQSALAHIKDSELQAALAQFWKT